MFKIGLIYTLCAVYAVVRYVAFAPHNAQHLPVFVLNKGISMAAALCFATAFYRQWRLQRYPSGVEPATWFRAGLFGAIAHVPLSLTILRPGYFKEFFLPDASRLTLTGETVILFGAVTLAGLYLLTRPNWAPHRRWWLSLTMMLTLFTHTLTMGIARGINLNASHAYLPPMWMLSLIGIAGGIVFLLMTYPREGRG